MTVWTVAFGFLIGNLMHNTIRFIVECVDNALTRYLDKKDHGWREKRCSKDVKPKEPIGFKQTTIES